MSVVLLERPGYTPTPTKVYPNIGEVYKYVTKLLDNNLVINEVKVLEDCEKELKYFRHECSNYDLLKVEIKDYIYENVKGRTLGLKVYNYCKNRCNTKFVEIIQGDRIKKEKRIKQLEEILNSVIIMFEEKMAA